MDIVRSWQLGNRLGVQERAGSPSYRAVCRNRYAKRQCNWKSGWRKFHAHAVDAAFAHGVNCQVRLIPVNEGMGP